MVIVAAMSVGTGTIRVRLFLLCRLVILIPFTGEPFRRTSDHLSVRVSFTRSPQ